MGGWKQGGTEQSREQSFPLEKKAHIENRGGERRGEGEMPRAESSRKASPE